MKIGLPGLVFLVFLVLKLTGHIAWSWWWVTAPLWGTGILVASFVIGFALMDASLGRRKR